jgi:chromosome segregation ATPase
MEGWMRDEGAGIGRPADFTEDEIIEAGLRVEARGHPVNAFRIRTELGGGNATRIRQVWARHRQSQTDPDAVTIDKLPFDLAPHAQSIAEAAAAEAQKNTESLYIKIYIELNDRLTAEFGKQLETLRDTLKSAESDIQATEDRLKQVRAENERLLAENLRLSEQTARLEERSTQLEKVAEEARREARQAHLDAIELVAASSREAVAAGAASSVEPRDGKTRRSRRTTE